MGSREREHPTHQVSSMVVRPSESSGGGGGGGGGGGSDYEPGEVRRGDGHHEKSFYSRPERFHDNHRQGYEMRAGSVSPLLQRKADHHYDSGFDHPGGQYRGRGFRGGRGRGRFRDLSPPYGRGRGGRSYGRGFDGPGFEPGPFRGEGLPRNNPNVSPREGDWICSDPTCGNLNFARRSYCNSCNKFRYGASNDRHDGSPRRNYQRPSSPRGPQARFSGPPQDRGPRRDMDEYGSPPSRVWGRGSPREFAVSPPSPRHGGRFPPHHIKRERPGYYEEDEYRGRGKFDRITPDWGPRGRGRGGFFHDRRPFNDRSIRGPLSPPPPRPPPHRDQWDGRERSRSPVRPGLRDYRRDPFVGRGRDDRRGVRRVRMNGAF